MVATTRFLSGGVLTAIAAGAVLPHLFAAGLLGPLVARLALVLLGPTPGVTAAAGLIPTTVVTGGSDSYAAQAITVGGTPGDTPGDTAGLLDLDVTAGSLADLRGDTVAVSADRARGKHVGRTVRLAR